MIFKFCVIFVYIVTVKWCSCQRRIIHGSVSETGKRYMVYLLNSKYSRVQQVGWLCGGALISETHILTSAACLTEVQFMYAIAGYRKYVSGENIDSDKCTSEKKKKVVETIIPAEFKSSKNPEQWMKYDVGIAIVEQPYNFTDITYYIICSYPPDKTFINYDKDFEEPGTAAFVYGWGGNKGQDPQERIDLNSEYMHEATTVITNTSFCAHYLNNDMKSVVYSSLLCAYGSGYVSRNGKESFPEPSFDDCLWRRFNLNDPNKGECNDTSSIKEGPDKLGDSLSMEDLDRRRNYDPNGDAGGICGNDHGGPLVAYFGTTEIIIGVSITSIYTSRYECEGPYLYFGTAKMAALIRCLRAINNETLALCKQLSYDAKKTIIKWPAAAFPKKKKATRTTHTLTTHTWTPRQLLTLKLKTKRTKQTTEFIVRHTINQNPIRMRVTVETSKQTRPNVKRTRIRIRPVKDIKPEKSTVT